MGIYYRESAEEFHLYNDRISYILKILRNRQMGQLYFGRRVPTDRDYGYLIENVHRPILTYVYDNEYSFSLESLRQEYPSYGTTDFRMPAVEVLQENGSTLTDFQYVSHRIYAGKQKLSGLPATYVEDPAEADTLEILLRDPLTGLKLTLLYTIFAGENAIARSARIENQGEHTCQITTAMSLSLDLPDADYDWIQFSGSWARERHVKTRRLQQGIQSVGSLRGASSHIHNPFVVLKRPGADEFQGEAMGFSLIYSGNFLAQAEVDTCGMTRMMLGIHPHGFSWRLKPGQSFQTPEAVVVYSAHGMNAMSQTFHRLYRTRLARGAWRDRERPVLINNWEATYFDFDEDKLVQIAQTAREDGVELFVLDDGWFGARYSDHAGLGDWYPNPERLPNGIRGLSERIEALGMKFGLWFEPEMVNADSDLFRAHPDWILRTPGRHPSHGRNQYVLDFSRKEVVDAVHEMMAKILSEAKISYIKWDMNRNITECYSAAYPPEQQGEIFHRYILGVYDLYERLTGAFPHILFESCAGGGGRFDPGMLYYAPQAWTSDDSDAVERIKIQYGSSFAYPVSSMGAHVSVTPNHQVGRNTSIKIRGDVASFGAFGYELDLTKLSPQEHETVRRQIAFVKKYRRLIHTGSFYRLQSPFEQNIAAWAVVSEDKRQAIAAWFKVLNDANGANPRFVLHGLDESLCYRVTEDEIERGCYFGSELMYIGLPMNGSPKRYLETIRTGGDFQSRLFVLEAVTDTAGENP